VSVFLAWFVARRPEFFRGQHVVELGAGCGLPGIIAARIGSASSLLTDGSKVVVRLLERQKGVFDAASYPSAGSLEVLNVEWGTAEGIEALQRKLNMAQREVRSVRPSVLIGADVVCWPSCVRPLLETVKALFLDLDDPFQGVMFIGYVCRATDTRDLFFAEAGNMGFCFEKIKAETFLPLTSVNRLIENEIIDFVGAVRNVSKSTEEVVGASERQRGWPRNVRSVYDLELYRISLDRTLEQALLPPALDYNGESQSSPF
jgi:hypothetical protein